jgi:hypothetical protein
VSAAGADNPGRYCSLSPAFFLEKNMEDNIDYRELEKIRCERLNFYCIIPASVLTDEKLSDIDKVIYAFIQGMVDLDGSCANSIEQIGIVSDKDEIVVRNSLKKLTRCGYVKVKSFQNENGQIHLEIYPINMNRRNV